MPGNVLEASVPGGPSLTWSTGLQELTSRLVHLLSFSLPGHGATCAVLSLKSPECLHLLRKMSSRRAIISRLPETPGPMGEPGSGVVHSPRY